MTKNQMIKAGIIGGAGYTAGELLRILLHHPNVRLQFVHSNSNAGKKIYAIHHDLLGETELQFSSKITQDIDVIFLCSGHGKSTEFLTKTTIDAQTKVIDLSNDFRLKSNATFGKRKFVYGLPELNKEKILTTENIANPGCFATAIQLALLPLAARGLLRNAIHVHGITGSTGAGHQPTQTTHFSWRTNNLSVYKAFSHQHLSEIKEAITQLQSNFIDDINFIPVRGNFTRGIFATVYTKSNLNSGELFDLYSAYYENAPFTIPTNRNISLKDVLNTNKCLLKIEKMNDYVFITSVIDNLVKGASGQAVHNMNLMCSLDEQAGLKLKSILF